jgi:hypothetical protein
MKLVALLCFFAFVGCGNLGEGPRGEQGPPGAGAAVEGERLLPQYRVTADGGRLLEGWYDSEVGGTCEWDTAIDGTERCFPKNRSNAAFLVLFSDDACTLPMLAIGKGECGTIPTAITWRLAHECGKRAWQVGANVQVSGLYLGEPAFCSPTGAQSFDVYDLPKELTADLIVGNLSAD